MEQRIEENLSPYRTFSRGEWAALREDTPMTLTSEEVTRLRSLHDRLDMKEVEDIYLSLSRLLSLYVAATQRLHRAQQRFLGSEEAKVPYIIGINWFIIIYCCGVAVHSLLNSLSQKLAEEMERPARQIKALSVIVDGATLAVVFDWLIEPVAVKLGYWTWLGDGQIPLFNYISWFVISMLLLLIFHLLPIQKQNKFAIHLLMIQVMFFVLLRTFLHA